MGGAESRTFHAGQGLASAPAAYSHIKSDAPSKTIVRSHSFVPNLLMNTPFNGIWSVYESQQPQQPPTRVGQFSVAAESACFVGYGSHNTMSFQDLWKLNMDTLEWSQIPLKGDIPEPRNGSRAVLFRDSHLIMFGGFLNDRYLNDVYAISITTGEVTKLTTKGPAPEPRSGPVMACYGDNVYVWGGFNGTWPNDLHVLDMTTLTWSEKATDVPGRTGVPFVRFGNQVISYGGSRQEGLLIIDLEKEEVKVKETTGASPPTEYMGAGMAVVGRYVLYYGGKYKNDRTLVYALDVERMWWFVFHVLPDHETVSLEDGYVTENGLFMLPRLHSFSCAYSKSRRQVLCFLGAPVQDSVEFFVFSVGTALSIINHREDMKDMLHQNETGCDQQ